MLRQYKTNLPYSNFINFVFVNFIDDEKHTGCRFHCPFCPWDNSGKSFYLCPTNQEIEEFITTFYPDKEIPHLTSITGGGDPLYRFEEKNSKELIRIINCLKDLNVKVDITTHEYETAHKYYETLLKDVDQWSFSIEIISDDIHKILEDLSKTGKKIRISKVYNLNKNIKSIDRDYLEKYINFYKDIPGIYIILKENFVFPLDNTLRDEALDFVHSLNYSRLHYAYKPHNLLILINDMVWYDRYFHDMLNYSVFHYDKGILFPEVKNLNYNTFVEESHKRKKEKEASEQN